jgi:hypothetical protein
MVQRPRALARDAKFVLQVPGTAMKKKAIGLLIRSAGFLGVFLVVGKAAAVEYYVSPTGSDSNAGSIAQPFATLQKGHDSAAAGDTVWIRGGMYHLTKQVKLSKSGSSDSNRIKFWAYQGEAPIFDCSEYATTNKAADVPVILVTGNWLHLRGFEVSNAKVGASGDHSYSLLRSEGASNNTFELLNLHHGFGPGLFISKGNGGNLILNCDSHDNYDKAGSQGDGQNGDGFGVHYQTSGSSTIIRGSRAWLNSDDGYDLIQQEYPVIVENSWAVQNGYANGGSTSPADGNGNGFKMGSSDTGVRHIVQRNVAWKNKAAGFYANHSSGGNDWYNNTSYMNGTQYNMLASPAGDPNTTITLTGSLAHKMRNNVGFPNKNSNMGGVDSASNTWDLSITEASSDFASTSDTGFTGPRQADGSMPAIDFLKLKANSPLIDKGTNVGLTYVGSAPDLGAYEYGAVGGSGGSSSMGGSSNGGASNAGSANGGVASGGRPNTGGATSSGGASSGGADAGGASAAGTTNAGGNVNVAGSSNNGGALPANGGNTSSAGALGAGGSFAPGSGGATGNASGGAPSGAGSANVAGARADDAAESNGCSCRLPADTETRSSSYAGLAWLALGFVHTARRRRARNQRVK